MASKKKRSKPAQVDSLTVRHLQEMRADMDRHSEALVAELRGVVDAFKSEVANAFRELQMRVTTALTDVAGSQAELKSLIISDNREIKAALAEIRSDRARMDALEARIALLEKRAS